MKKLLIALFTSLVLIGVVMLVGYLVIEPMTREYTNLLVQGQLKPDNAAIARMSSWIFLGQILSACAIFLSCLPTAIAARKYFGDLIKKHQG